MLIEGGLVITNISHNPLLGTGEVLILQGTRAIALGGDILFIEWERPSGKGEEGKRQSTHASIIAAFQGTQILERSTYTHKEKWPVTTLEAGMP